MFILPLYFISRQNNLRNYHATKKFDGRITGKAYCAVWKAITDFVQNIRSTIVFMCSFHLFMCSFHSVMRSFHLVMCSFHALFLCVLFMRSLYVLFLCALFMCSSYAPFLCALSMRSLYSLFLCALFIRSFYVFFLCTLFMCFFKRCFICSFHKRQVILQMHKKYYCTKTNMADNKMNDVLKKLGLSDQNSLRKRYQLTLLVIYL